MGDPGSVPELGRSPGEGNGNPFQYYCLENPMEGYSPWGSKELYTIERLHFHFGAFNPFTFKVIIDKYDLVAIYFIVLGLILYTLSVFPV